MNRDFTFGGAVSCVRIQDNTPSIGDIMDSAGKGKAVLVCDTHTAPIAQRILGDHPAPLCILGPGETSKNWASIEAILRTGKDAGLARDGLFIGVGGGVISDMTAFAASIYMRGAKLCLVSTSLLGMADAALGGKTGFDLFDMKNLAGTFYPAPLIYMPIAALSSLPDREWKSGMAELIKTAILDNTDEAGVFLALLASLKPLFQDLPISPRALQSNLETLAACIARSVGIKGRIVEADPQETGGERALLNLGHTFGHALESSAGLGRISHGEAVAWGMARACELGRGLGVTPKDRKDALLELLRAFGYETAAPHPLMGDLQVFMKAIQGDKKKKAGKLNFVVPAQTGAVMVSGEQVDPGLLARVIGDVS